MTHFETAALIITAWTLIGFALAPFVGRFLRGCSTEYRED